MEELEALLAKIITRIMRLLTRLALPSKNQTRPTSPKRIQWRAAVAAGRLVHLSYCAGAARWPESAELLSMTRRRQLDLKGKSEPVSAWLIAGAPQRKRLKRTTKSARIDSSRIDPLVSDLSKRRGGYHEQPK